MHQNHYSALSNFRGLVISHVYSLSLSGAQTLYTGQPKLTSY